MPQAQHGCVGRGLVWPERGPHVEGGRRSGGLRAPYLGVALPCRFACQRDRLSLGHRVCPPPPLLIAFHQPLSPMELFPQDLSGLELHCVTPTVNMILFSPHQIELAVLQFAPIASHLVAGHHQKESRGQQESYQYSEKIPSQPFLLQAKQAELPQPFLLREMLGSPNHLCSSLLDSLQELQVSIVLGSPALDMSLQMWPYQG